MIKYTIYDDFFDLELSGEFENETEMREFYAQELDTFPQDIVISAINDIPLFVDKTPLQVKLVTEHLKSLK